MAVQPIVATIGEAKASGVKPGFGWSTRTASSRTMSTATTAVAIVNAVAAIRTRYEARYCGGAFTGTPMYTRPAVGMFQPVRPVGSPRAVSETLRPTNLRTRGTFRA